MLLRHRQYNERHKNWHGGTYENKQNQWRRNTVAEAIVGGITRWSSVLLFSESETNLSYDFNGSFPDLLELRKCPIDFHSFLTIILLT